MARRVLRVERSVFIARPDWEVFTFVADAENEVLWRPKVLHVRKTYAGPMGLGAAYWCVVKGLLGRRTGIIRVTAYEPDRFVAFSGSFDGGAQPTDFYRVAPEGAGGARARGARDAARAHGGAVRRPLEREARPRTGGQSGAPEASAGRPGADGCDHRRGVGGGEVGGVGGPTAAGWMRPLRLRL